MTQDPTPSESASNGTAIDSWLHAVVHSEDLGDHIRAQLRSEIPPLLSWIVRGGCAVQCEHCIFPFEGPKGYSERLSAEVLISVLEQLTGSGHLVHEGRQLLPHQVPVLAAIKRAGYSVSVINNGQYVTPAMLSLCEREGLEIDTLDVSVDGTERTHNAQRASQQAYAWAMKGLTNARRLVSPTGKVTSLYTLSSLNCDDVRETGEMLAPLVDEWHLTTMSLRPGLEHMRADERELTKALEQLLGSTWERPVFLRTYSLADFVVLLQILGKETARKALSNAMVEYNAIVLDVGIPLYFYPKSLQVNETLVVDADGWWRVPFCIQHSLEDLQRGTDAKGNDLSHFSIARVSEELDVPTVFAETAEKWWRAIGKESFSAELATVQRFLG
ncbi:MAG TPA: radical SAM protein [Candidatus Paceibacterota bacterium]|jgi:hypothetical protein